MECYIDLCQIWSAFICLVYDNKMSLMLIKMRIGLSCCMVSLQICVVFISNYGIMVADNLKYRTVNGSGSDGCAI